MIYIKELQKYVESKEIAYQFVKRKTWVLAMVGSPTIACSSGDTPQTLFKPPGPPLRLAGVGVLKHRPQVKR